MQREYVCIGLKNASAYVPMPYAESPASVTGNSHRLTARVYWNLRTHWPSPHSLYCASLCFKVRWWRPWNTEITNSSSILKFSVFQGFKAAQIKLHSDVSWVLTVITFVLYVQKVELIYHNTYFCGWSRKTRLFSIVAIKFCSSEKERTPLGR